MKITNICAEASAQNEAAPGDDFFRDIGLF